MNTLSLNFTKNLTKNYTNKFSLKSNFNNSYKSLFNLSKQFIASGASYRKNNNEVKLKGTFLKSRREDMPTMIWLPEMMEEAESFTNFFNNPHNRVLDYRNVWLLNPRNFGNSDHHDSFSLEEQADDIVRFMDEKKITMATIGGHGFGAKIACAFGSNNLERTTGVICMEGGPIDFGYHIEWEKLSEGIVNISKINLKYSSINEVYKNIDNYIQHPRWRSIIKKNLQDSSGTLSWKFNMEALSNSAVKGPRSELATWSSRHGLFPGKSLVFFAQESNWVYLNTNTIPIYSFFPLLENKFPSQDFNFVQGDNDEMNHWCHEYPANETNKVGSKIATFLKQSDGVHPLLTDRSEIGIFGVPERESRWTTGINFATEYTPEHVHHNYKNDTSAYTKSKQERGQESAGNLTTKGMSNPKYW